MGLYREGARPHGRTDLIPHQRAVSEAQGSIGLEVESEMMIEVRRIIPTHAQDTTALGLSCLSSPECRGPREGQGRQCHAGSKASFQEITTAHTLDMLLHFHRNPLCDATDPATTPRHDCRSRR